MVAKSFEYIAQVKAGKLRPLAVTSAKRVDDIPQTPTVGESGYKGFDTGTWYGLLMPAGTPKAEVPDRERPRYEQLVSDWRPADMPAL